MKATAIIGANYGDEGKGLMTDYIASQQPNPIVVRSNGGAQAGHTVITHLGDSHVFSHIGAGNFAGAETYLSEFFISNPMLFYKECKKIKPNKIYVNANSPLTTPWDMMINQQLETSRGNARHGSCGVGIGETIERNTQELYALTVGDIKKPFFSRKLNAILRVYMNDRLVTLGLQPINTSDTIYASINAQFEADCLRFVADCEVVSNTDCLNGKSVIFEGAQGLLLDQTYGAFPHVTRSNTGMQNIAEICKQHGITEVDAIYTTRCYTTRHGAGPLDHEVDNLSYVTVVDNTNKPHEYQGTIRHAPLDLDLLAYTIDADISRVSGIKVNKQLAITCMDQLNDATVCAAEHGEVYTLHKSQLVSTICKRVNPSKTYMSLGPTRRTIISHF